MSTLDDLVVVLDNDVEASAHIIRAIVADDQPWADDALCAQSDPEAWFPEKGGSTRDAKATCARCLVRAECLEYALANDERFGVWGGLSERERRRLSSRITH